MKTTRASKAIVDGGRRAPATENVMSCSRYVLRERLANGSTWTSDPIDGDQRHAAQNVAAGMSNVEKGGARWAETLKGALVAGSR